MIPGWFTHSWGVSGSGQLYAQSMDPIQIMDPWKVGDTIGFGINFETSRIFFVQNGKVIEPPQCEIPQEVIHTCYPTVGSNMYMQMWFRIAQLILF